MGLVDRLFLPVAKHFIAGPTLADAVITAKEMNSRGFKVIVNFLGEEIRDQKELDQTMAEYLSIFDQMDQNKIEWQRFRQANTAGPDHGLRACREEPPHDCGEG